MTQPFDFSKLKYTTPIDKIKAVGAPDVPQRILDGLKKYEDSSRGFTIYGFEYDKDGQKGGIFVDHRPEDAQVAQVYRMPSDPSQTDLERITYFDLGTGRVIADVNPIKGDDWRGTWRAGGALMLMDIDGKEYFQFWRICEDTAGQEPLPHIGGELNNKPSTFRLERLTHDDSIRFGSPLIPHNDHSFMVFSSTEDGPANYHIYMTRLVDSNTGTTPTSSSPFDLPRMRITETPASGKCRWSTSSISVDKKYLALTQPLGSSYQPLYVLDISDPAKLPALPELITLPGATERQDNTSNSSIAFSRDPTTPHRLHFITDAYGDFRAAVTYDLNTRTVLHITAAEPALQAIRPIPWDIRSQALTDKILYFTANIDGWSKPHCVPLIGPYANQVIEMRLQGPGDDSAGIGFLHNAKDGRPYELCIVLASYKSSGGIAYADIEQHLERVQTDNNGHLYITVPFTLYKQAQPIPPAFKTPAPKLVRFKSFDGLEVPFVYYHPYDGKKRVPLNVEIHGGPAVQATTLRKSRIHGYLLNELECAVIYPNVRGSIGYGKKYMQADDVYLREDSVKDIGALLDYVAEHLKDEIDSSNIAVSGGSYGGYMTFACLTHYSHKLACGLATCGIADWVAFLTNTAAHRQDNRRLEYGDETDPDVRAFLQRISPVSNADKITVPLWIAHGDNDSRVPFEQAYFMYDSLIRRGLYAELVVGVTEGHGFKQKSVLEWTSGSKVLFLERFFLKAGAPRSG